MDLPHPMRSAGIVENALSRSCLAGIDVGHDADVAQAFEWSGSRHVSLGDRLTQGKK